MILRKVFCIGSAVLVAAIIAQILPRELLENVPMIRAALFIHGLVLGFFLTLAGPFNRLPLWDLRFHPILRGGLMAAFVHLDFTIYTWMDPPVFWRTIVFAAIFGAIIDTIATQLFGDGKKLLRDLSK